MPSLIILVTAAGPNVGAAVSKKFAGNGYKVTLAARSLSERIQSNGHLYVKADLSSSGTVPQIFYQVKKKPWYPENCWLQWSCVPSSFSYSSLSNYPRCSSPCYLPDAQFQHRSKCPESRAMSAWAMLILERKSVCPCQPLQHPCFARVAFLKHGCTPKGEMTGGQL
jgi:hypothetical protein